MNPKIEGTVVLDGLLEAPLPDSPNAEKLLRDWRERAATAGLPFSLEIQENSFSILADSHPIEVDGLGDPAETVRRALQELIELFPPPLRRRIMSTIRSVEYQSGLAVQTLYTVGPDNSMAANSRTVDAETTPPPKPMDRRSRIRLALAGLVTALVLLGISAFFIDYRAKYREIVDRWTPLDVSAIEISCDSYDPYFKVTAKRALSEPSRQLLLTFERTDAYPLKPADLDALAAAQKTLQGRLAVESLARGYVRCEYFTRDGKYVEWVELRIAPLRDNPKAELALPLPREYKLGKVVMK